MRIVWLRPSKGEQISTRRERIAEWLRDAGHHVDIIDATGLDGFSAVWKVLRGNYDVIAGNVRIGLYLGFPLAKLLRTPFLGDVSDPITDIDSLPDPIYRALERYEWFVLKRADASVFVHPSIYGEALDRGIEAAQQLPNAVNFDDFANPDPDVVATAKSVYTDAGVDLSGPIGIYIGNFESHYHIPELLDASELVPSWQFVFIGEGPLDESVHQRASDQPNVYHLGIHPHHLMPGFLAHADVAFCLKDAEETLKLKEYGAAGLPTFVPPGLLERWYDTDELVFVNPTPTSIAESLEELVSVPELRKSGMHLQTKVQEHTWEDIAAEYAAIFERIT